MLRKRRRLSPLTPLGKSLVGRKTESGKNGRQSNTSPKRTKPPTPITRDESDANNTASHPCARQFGTPMITPRPINSGSSSNQAPPPGEVRPNTPLQYRHHANVRSRRDERVDTATDPRSRAGEAKTDQIPNPPIEHHN